MVGFRRLSSRINELNGKYFSINGLIFFIIVVVIMHAPYYVKSLGIESNQIICSDSKTCIKCTNKTLCSWSIEKQTCVNTKQILGSLTIHNETHCPHFSVVKRSSVVDVSFKYTVKISNDVKDFVTFLSKSTITCCLESCYFKGSVVNDEIICEAIRTPSSYFSNYTKAMISYVYIMFDDLELKFDNDTDYYYTIYDRECINESDRDDCVTCLWNDDDYRYYLKWCSSNNQCMGSYTIYEKRVINDNKKFRYIEDNVHIKCPNIKIQSIEPTWALWTGSTTMTITVRNHWILLENLQTFIVTVAGFNCADPKTYDKDTITCIIISPSVANTNWTDAELDAEMQRSNQHVHVDGGPVEVVYASSTKFTVQSTTTVNFVKPEITEISPVCGPVEGGTLLIVHGKFLDTDGCTVRVSVGDVPCVSATQYPGGITCRTGPSAAMSGVVRVELAQHRQTATALLMYGPVYAYTSDPVLNAGQSFDGIEAGGMTISVHGSGFATGCGNDIVNATFYVDDHSGARHYASVDCLVKNDSCMVCRTPKLQRPQGPGRDASMIASPLITLHNFGITVVIRRRRWSRDSANVKSSEVLIDEILDLTPPPSLLNSSAANAFFLYADPMYTDFEIDNDDSSSLVINSRGDTGKGYRTNDVTIRLQNSTITDCCVVISMNQHRIVCHVASVSTAGSIINLVDLRSIVVSIGDGLVYSVHKRITDRYNNNNYYYTLKLFTTASSCGIVVVIVVILLIISVILYRLKTKNHYVVSNDSYGVS